MSDTEPTLGPEPEPAPPSPPRWRRWLRRVLWGLGTVLVLLAVLHSPPAKRAIATLLARAAGAALGGDVRLSRLEYRLWAGEVSVEGVEVRTPRLEIDCPRAEAVVGLRSGLRMDIDSPRVVVTQGPPDHEPKLGPEPSRPWAIIERFDAVDLRGGAVEIRRDDGLPWLRLEGIDAQIAEEDDRPRGSARVTEAAIGWPAAGIRLEEVRVEADFEVDPTSGALRVLRGALVSAQAALEGRGQLRQLGPILATADGGGRIDAGLARRLVPALELDGRLDARVSFEKDTTGARGSLEVEIADLVAYDLGPWAGSIRGLSTTGASRSTRRPSPATAAGRRPPEPCSSVTDLPVSMCGLRTST